jgi:hypothetical protein
LELARKQLWSLPAAVPPSVAPIYEYRITDGAIRHGTRILIDMHKHGEILINLQLTSGHTMIFRKRDVIAHFARGSRPSSFNCPNCGGHVRYESVGRMDYLNWPAGVKWLPKNLYHGDTCLGALIQEFPIHSEWDPIGRAKRNGRKKARYYDGNQYEEESEL